MRILVLGGTRFLGPFLVDELLRRGHDIAVLSRRTAQFAGDVRHYEGNASEPQTLRRIARSWRPEAVVDAIHSNAEHARAVVSALGAHVGRSVHLSCGAVYGDAAICPVDESSELAASDEIAPAAAAQMAADEVVATAISEADLPGVIVRLPELYGPRDPRCAEWFFAKRVFDNRPRIALPDAGLHICHRGFVQNMAWGIAQALSSRRAVGQIYNLGEEKLYTLAQLATGIARALDHRWEIYSVPGHLWATPYASTRFFDLRKARAQLRYRDRMIPRDGLEITMTWLSQHPRGDDWSWPGIEAPFDYAREDALIKEHGRRMEG